MAPLAGGGDGDGGGDAERRSVAALAVADEDMAKLVPGRIASLCLHPSPAKLLAAAADTEGRVGLWDVDSQV